MYKINFPGYDELFLDDTNSPRRSQSSNSSQMYQSQTSDINNYNNILNYQTTRFNTYMLDSKNIDAENEISGRNYKLTKGGMDGFIPGTTKNLQDNRPVLLNTPELFHSAYNIKDRKTCNTVLIEPVNRIQPTYYTPHPSVFYQPNTFQGQNSREIKRLEYLNKK